jgi:hypothetical protein
MIDLPINQFPKAAEILDGLAAPREGFNRAKARASNLIKLTETAIPPIFHICASDQID